MGRCDRCTHSIRRPFEAVLEFEYRFCPNRFEHHRTHVRRVGRKKDKINHNGGILKTDISSNVAAITYANMLLAALNLVAHCYCRSVMFIPQWYAVVLSWAWVCCCVVSSIAQRMDY